MGKCAFPTNFYYKSPDKEKFVKQPGSALDYTLVTRITEVLQFAVMGVKFFHVMVPIKFQ